MESKELTDELQAMQKGHGVHRPDVRSWLGPCLLTLIHATPSADDATLRQNLIGLLIDAAATLPPDLRYVFLTTSGVVNDRPLLQERKAQVGAVLKRDARTVARRMRKAESLIAERLLKTPDSDSPYDPKGWRNQSVRYDIRLDQPRPLVGVSQVVSPIRSGQTEFQQGVFIPGSAATTDDVKIRALKGCSLVRWQRDTERSWIAVFQLDAALNPGQLHQLSYELDFPGFEYLTPRAVFGPVRPCAQLQLRINFGVPHAASQAWLLSGVPAALMNERPLTPNPVMIGDDGVAEVEFTDLTPGLMYGVAWDWLEALESAG